MIADRSLPTFALLLALLAAPAAATSFVPMTDEALVDQAPAAAVVRIVAVDSGAGWATEYRAQVEQRLKGRLPEASLRVRVIGGDGPNGLSLHIYGAPRFAVGERALLLLEPVAGGAVRPVQLFLGAFHEVSGGGGRFAVRDLSQASEVRVSVDGTAKAVPPQPDRLRDFDAFARWIARRAQGLAGPADYLVNDRVNDKFTFFSDPNDHLNLRWFVFDDGGHVEWKAFSTGQKGVPGGGYAQFQAALAAWTAEPQTPIDYRYAGTTNSRSALTEPDGVNAIVFNDPNSLINPFSCSAGGVLAIGGPFYTTATLLFHGQAFHRITEGDIVVSDGLECFFAQSPNAAKAAEEIFGHELGHTLGLGHSCGDSRSPACAADPAFDAALMRAFVHNDGRGARLGTDDQAGVRTLYGAAAAPLAAPSQLAAAVVSPTEVRLTWTDESTDETEFRVELKPPDADFVEVGAVAADSTQALVQGLLPATAYSFRVRASRSGTFSEYSNVASLATDAPPGPCLASGTALCIHGRFQVGVAWKASSSSFGAGQVMPVASADSGLFWFTSPDNLELLVKVLDGCSLNHHYWVYTGPATDAQLTLTVIDTQTGKVRVYVNPLGVAAGATTDTEAFATCP
ncbi:MAG: fibronectin type III domain-containing protein [Thermoanaerobaculia bacterium]